MEQEADAGQHHARTGLGRPRWGRSTGPARTVPTSTSGRWPTPRQRPRPRRTCSTPPTPPTGWAFLLGDIDADKVTVSAKDADGRPVDAALLGFVQGFNLCDSSSRPGAGVGAQCTPSRSPSPARSAPIRTSSSPRLRRPARARWPEHQSEHQSEQRPDGALDHAQPVPGAGWPAACGHRNQHRPPRGAPRSQARGGGPARDRGLGTRQQAEALTRRAWAATPSPSTGPRTATARPRAPAARPTRRRTRRSWSARRARPPGG